MVWPSPPAGTSWWPVTISAVCGSSRPPSSPTAPRRWRPNSAGRSVTGSVRPSGVTNCHTFRTSLSANDSLLFGATGSGPTMTEVQTQSDHMRLTRTRVGGSVPFVARVGVTGHRRIASDDLERLNYEIGCAFTKVGELFNVGGATPLQVRVVTSLAEGADRMVAKAVLQMDGQLEVILPVPVSQYMVDFESPESRAEFEDLLAHAGPPREGPEFASRADSYAWASRQMVEGSDVLIAIWDGQPTRGKGGTADTVRYALATRTPVIWIPMDGSGLKWDTGEGPVDRAFGNAGAERAGRSAATTTTHEARAIPRRLPGPLQLGARHPGTQMRGLAQRQSARRNRR